MLLGGALTMTGDRLYKKWKRTRFHTPHVQQPENTTDKICLSLTPPEMAHKLYHLMQIVHEVFDELTITYWADSGTLLGAVRNGGLIATDDDIDLCIFEKDAHKLYKEVRTKLRARGCDIISIEPCEKICFAKDVTKTIDPKTGKPSYRAPSVGVDIFTVKEEKENIYTYANARANAVWSGTQFYKTPELFPLRLAPFGPLMIWIPYDPHAYLDRTYQNWNKDAYITNFHKGGGIEPFTVPLTPELRKPAPWKAGFAYIKEHPAPSPPIIDLTKVGG